MTIFELRILACRIDHFGIMSCMDDYCRLDEYDREATIAFDRIHDGMTRDDIVDVIRTVCDEDTITVGVDTIDFDFV
jgi:hypothetical protein